VIAIEPTKKKEIQFSAITLIASTGQIVLQLQLFIIGFG
jgi:hypothetical protein